VYWFCFKPHHTKCGVLYYIVGISCVGPSVRPSIRPAVLVNVNYVKNRSMESFEMFNIVGYDKRQLKVDFGDFRFCRSKVSY